jgi:hypothetical protein
MKLSNDDILFFEEKIAKITPELIVKIEEQKIIYFMGMSMEFGDDKYKFYTMDGIYKQVEEFERSIGLIYWIDLDTYDIQKKVVALI